MPDGAAPVLDVRGLKTVFRTRQGEVHAVNNVSFSLQKGELLGVVGESGSGKSVTMMSLIGLLPSPPADVRAGQVFLGVTDILKISPEDLRNVRGAYAVDPLLATQLADCRVVLVDDGRIRELNRDYLGRDRPTNVISFPQQEGGGLRALTLPAVPADLQHLLHRSFLPT